MGDLSDHFSRWEFRCKCGNCNLDTVDVELLRILEAIRAHFDRPIEVTSGFRCLAHNRAVGGAAPDSADNNMGGSQHLYGRAADIKINGIDPALVYELADQMGIGGAGKYDTFTHVDSRTNGPARWRG